MTKPTQNPRPRTFEVGTAIDRIEKVLDMATTSRTSSIRIEYEDGLYEVNICIKAALSLEHKMLEKLMRLGRTMKMEMSIGHPREINQLPLHFSAKATVLK